jgi:hypothetical protein
MADADQPEPRDERTEQTPKGLTVPIPKRGAFFANLCKITKVDKGSAPGRSPQK